MLDCSQGNIPAPGQLSPQSSSGFLAAASFCPAQVWSEQAGGDAAAPCRGWPQVCAHLWGAQQDPQGQCLCLGVLGYPTEQCVAGWGVV